MNCIIITPERELFQGSAKSVRVPGTSGSFEVLEGHAPIVSSLEEGVVRVIGSDNRKHEYQIESGFVEVLRNEVSVMVTEPKQNQEESD